jgi:hypothetical protein
MPIPIVLIQIFLMLTELTLITIILFLLSSLLNSITIVTFLLYLLILSHKYSMITMKLFELISYSVPLFVHATPLFFHSSHLLPYQIILEFQRFFI